VKTATDLNTLPELAELLAADGWYIHEYEVIASNTVRLTIVQKEKREADDSE
jgi:hypothetical protein